MKEYEDREWSVFEFIPDLIVVHSGVQAGEPTIKATRVPTCVASNAYRERDWRGYRIKKEQAFAAFCFEAGRDYEKNKRKINKAVNESWARYNRTHYPEFKG